MASKNAFNSEVSSGLPKEYSSALVEYELNRLHKRLDEMVTSGVLPIKTRRVSARTVVFFSEDCVVECDTAINAVTLQGPRASEMIRNRLYGVKDWGGLAATRNIVFLPFPGETIDGATSRTISSNYGSFLFYSDGSKLLVLS